MMSDEHEHTHTHTHHPESMSMEKIVMPGKILNDIHMLRSTAKGNWNIWTHFDSMWNFPVLVLFRFVTLVGALLKLLHQWNIKSKDSAYNKNENKRGEK